MTLKIGADPELFLKKKDIFVSAFGIIPGTKEKPHPVKNGAIQVDGMALEFNINPADTKQDFITNINEVLQALRNMVPKEFDFSFEASAHFDIEYLRKQPLAAIMLGCDPDYNAYSGKVNPRPNQNKPIRTAAGHVHIGWLDKIEDGKQHWYECMSLVKQLDFMLGIPSLLLDSNTERRKMYGKAGAFRPKPYGVEYRVLSNFWLQQDKYAEWVFETTEIAFYNLKKGINYFNVYKNLAREIINKNDFKAAERFISAEKLSLPQIS